MRNFGVALMLGIAYAASIGGVGTLIGTPPNALLASFLATTYDIQITFFTWMLIGMPVVIVMLPMAWLLLTKRDFSDPPFADRRRRCRDRARTRGPRRHVEGREGGRLVFGAAAASWIFRSQIVWLYRPAAR